MRFREKAPSKSFINLTPLVDMLFIILLFFLVTSTFIEQPNIQLELPTTKHTPTSKVDEQVLTISRDGRLYFQNEPVARKDLIPVLQKAFSNEADKTLVLRADKNVSYGLVVDIMDAAKGAGLKKIVAPTVINPEDRAK